MALNRVKHLLSDFIGLDLHYRVSRVDHLLNPDIVGLRRLIERAEASLATEPDQNRHVLVARQSAKYLEQPMGMELRLLYTDSSSL